MKNTLKDKNWRALLADELNSDYFTSLNSYLLSERKNELIFPLKENVFNAFNQTPLNSLKVIVIGQDPYHSFETINDEITPHAQGLSFSVPKNAKKMPPSLKNIFKELNNDLGTKIPNNGDLTPWAKQGVLLLNATLTVKAHQPGSHQKKGWEIFTDTVIKKIADQKKGIIFILWGNFAQKKELLINTNNHYILKGPHPSPFSAHKGFYGCKHFSKTNTILKKNGEEEIDWQIK